MTSSDDPPFLNVGTEVSAKYRGAFCEATIKIAKKLVKCKISYTKGGTEVVSNDVIKGPLKVNATVEVRGSDGVYVSGVITRLTDASTYTVVFDDNDERTLKRSSLCLKGARHYSASESLDQMPLTDPENFGTPVHYQSKRGQRKRQPQSSSSASPESGNDTTVLSPPKKQATPQATPTNKKQSEEFPVGRCVFLENDRRRSCWLPAVVVPSHYVMDVSEVSEDTVCIRSFKDGRFYAAKVDELHSFSPDKEPLSSMLEGEIQAMFMCKPAIERAMAYLDTGELPWDMQLLDTKESLSSKDESEPTENQTAERENFYKRLRQFQEERNIAVPQKPLLCHKELDLFKLHCLVKENGGMERVTQELKWRSLYLQLGLPPATNSSHIIKQAYKKHLNAFDIYERTRLESKSPRGPRKRPMAVVSSDNEDESSKVMKLESVDSLTPIVLPPPTSSPSSLPLSSSTESMGESSTADRLVEGGGARGGAQVDEIKVNDRIKVMYGKGRTLQNYEAKVLEVDGLSYYVHYNGWNTRYDEWIDNTRVVEKVTTPSKGVSRPPYARKKQAKLRPKPSKDNSVHPAPDCKPQDTPPTVTMPTVTTPTNTYERPTKGKRRRVSSNTDNSSSDTPSPGESTPVPADKRSPTDGLTLPPPPPDSAHSRQIDSSPDTGRSEDIPIKAHVDDSIAVEPSLKEEESEPPLEEREVGGDCDSSSDDESVPVPSPPAPPTGAPPTDGQPPSPPPTLVPSDHQTPSPVDPVDPGLTVQTPTEEEVYDNSNSVMEAESEVMDTPPSPVAPHLLDTLVGRQEVGVAGGGASSDEKMIQREDLDFSIDMSIYNGLNSSERISLIQERMKAIQNKYMELKSEVTYLDRKRRRARKREREVARLMASRGSGLSAEESINNLISASSMQQGMDIEASS